ncbi:tyrosine-type recombinase/integrase [Bradyrhizobium sp. UFLA05-153]
MPRKQRSPLETATARQRLPIRKKPHWQRLGPGLSLGYRRNAGAGTWSVRASDHAGGEWLKRFGTADDHETADGKRVLDYTQAVDAARTLVRPADAADDPTKPLTLDQALTAYGRDLEARGANPYNAKQPRVHLTAALLAKPLALITAHDLKHWRDALVAKGKVKPATINRVMNSLQAALELTAKHRSHIWRQGLESLPDSQRARNIVLTDAKVLELVAECYARDAALGLLADVLAVTGARPGQATRLRCDDLILGTKPKLMMPRSGKGGGRNRAAKKAHRYSVPITPALASRLQRAAADRAAGAFLLLRSDGQPWDEKNPHADYRRDVLTAIEAANLDPKETTLYCLRHSSITRALLRGVPIRIVAASHDTSTQMVEKNYARYITEHSDDVSRAALLLDEPPPSNVTVLAPRR